MIGEKIIYVCIEEGMCEGVDKVLRDRWRRRKRRRKNRKRKKLREDFT